MLDVYNLPKRNIFISREDLKMSQHPEDKSKTDKSKKSADNSTSGKSSNVKSGHGNAREKSPRK